MITATILSDSFKQQHLAAADKYWFSKVTPRKPSGRLVELLTVETDDVSLTALIDELVDYTFVGFVNNSDRPRFVHNSIKE